MHRHMLLALAVLCTVATASPVRVTAQSYKRILTLREIPLVNGLLPIEALGEQRTRIRLAGRITVTASGFAVKEEDGNVQLVSVGDDAETIATGGTTPIVGPVIVSFQKGSATLELFTKQTP